MKFSFALLFVLASIGAAQISNLTALSSAPLSNSNTSTTEAESEKIGAKTRTFLSTQNPVSSSSSRTAVSSTRTLITSSVSSSKTTGSPTSSVILAPTTVMPESQITEAPSLEDLQSGVALQEKWHLTTYWSCVTIYTDVHCGWHEPVVPGGGEVAAAGRVGVRKMSLVGLVVGVMGVLGIL